MQNCRAELDCRREKEREAQNREHVYCLQDETARKDKAGMQSSIFSALLLTAAPYKTSVPEFSITDYLIKAHIRQHKSRPWLGPTHSPPLSLLWL